jgi:MFS transporter, DHA1 family, inner membrane transport protein
VSSVMLGLAVALVAGVPLATWLGQHVGWRAAYWAVVLLAAATVAAVLAVVPSSPGRREATVRGELTALRRPQVLLTLLAATIGFGGMFALYSYIAPLATDVAGLARGALPWLLFVYGIGGVAGTTLGGRLADWAVFRSVVGTLVATGVVLALIALTAPWPPALFAGVFLLSLTGSALVVCLQLRLMETAGDAQMLGAALTHSALNMANALGAWLGGLVIAAGLGFRAPSAIGVALAAGGLVPLGLSAVLRRRELSTRDRDLAGVVSGAVERQPLPSRK